MDGVATGCQLGNATCVPSNGQMWDPVAGLIYITTPELMWERGKKFLVHESSLYTISQTGHGVSIIIDIIDDGVMCRCCTVHFILLKLSLNAMPGLSTV